MQSLVVVLSASAVLVSSVVVSSIAFVPAIAIAADAGAAAKNDAQALDLIRKLERNSRGETFSGDMAMTVNHRDNVRKLGIRVWSRGQERVLLRVLEPARDKGTGNLRIKSDLWQYLPRVEKTIKVPSSLLFQSWMGSDFSNDDLVKSSHLERDYTHKFVAEEKVGTIDAVKIEGTPRPESKIVWGKVYFWVTPKDGALVQQEFYTEAGKLVKQLKGFDHKTFGKYTIPTRLTMQDLTREKSMTEIVYAKVEFDKDLPDQVFTLKELEKALP